MSKVSRLFSQSCIEVCVNEGEVLPFLFINDDEYYCGPEDLLSLFIFLKAYYKAQSLSMGQAAVFTAS